MKKILRWAVIVVVALAVVLVLARNVIARRSVEIGVAQVTGFPLEIGSVNVGLFSGKLDVQNLKLMNPPEFHGGTFVDLPLFKVEYKTLSMLTGSPHINELVVNVEQVVLVTNEKGEVNANALQAKLSATSGGQAKSSEPSKETKKAKYRVDLVRIHIGTVIKRSYTKGQQTETKITMNKDVVFKDINESTSIASLVSRAVFGQVGEVAGELLKGAGGALKGASDDIQKTGKGLMDTLKKAVPSQQSE